MPHNTVHTPDDDRTRCLQAVYRLVLLRRVCRQDTPPPPDTGDPPSGGDDPSLSMGEPRRAGARALSPNAR